MLDYDRTRLGTATGTLPENYRGWHTLHVHVRDARDNGSNEDTFVFLTKDLAMDSITNHGRNNTAISWNKDTRVISAIPQASLLSATLI